MTGAFTLAAGIDETSECASQLTHILCETRKSSECTPHLTHSSGETWQCTSQLTHCSAERLCFCWAIAECRSSFRTWQARGKSGKVFLLCSPMCLNHVFFAIEYLTMVLNCLWHSAAFPRSSIVYKCCVDLVLVVEDQTIAAHFHDCRSVCSNSSPLAIIASCWYTMQTRYEIPKLFHNKYIQNP